MLAKTAAALAPIVFLGAAAVPPPDHWEFLWYAALGAFAGAGGRLSLSVYAETVKAAALGVWLSLASFWVGVITALVVYGLGLIDGSNNLKIIAVAAVGSLFGVLLEMLGARYIKRRAARLDLP